MTLLEKLIEKKNNLNATGLVRACAGLLMSATILTGCANAGEIKGNETSTTKEGTSITERAKSETELNYEKLIEACQKTDALGPLELSSEMELEDMNTKYSSYIYISGNNSAERATYNNNAVYEDAIVLIEDNTVSRMAEYINRNKNGSGTDEVFHTSNSWTKNPNDIYSQYSSATLTERVSRKVEIYKDQKFDYSVNYDKKTNTYSIVVNDGQRVLTHSLKLNSNGVVETFDTYDDILNPQHYVVKTIGEAEFNKMFAEYSEIAQDFSDQCDEEKANKLNN